MLKQVRSLQWPQWILNEKHFNTRRSGKTVKDCNSSDVWVKNERQRTKNEEPPLSNSLVNSSKRLSRPDICKKQQDLQLSMNLTRVFVFYNPPPSRPNPKGRKPRLPSKSLKMLSRKERQEVSRL